MIDDMVKAFANRAESPGYHERTILKGELGELSKILEETLEAIDADEQGSKIMTLIELSDLLGAIKAYLHKHCDSITIDDLDKMSSLTSRAFTSGRRS